VSFSVLERVKLAEKILAAGVRDSDPTTQWYESTNPELLVVLSDRVWTQGGLVRQYPAANLTVARANAAGPLAGVVQDYSQPVDSVRLTPDVAVNNTFIALTTYGDYSSARLDQWVQPQVVPQTSGLPSFGYSVRLYDGDPNAGGTEVLTTDGTTGTGINKSVGWIWSYTNGVLMLADDFAVADPWILGFRYIGDTVDDIVSTLKLSLIAGEALTAGDLVAINASGQAVKAISTYSTDKWRLAGVAYTDAAALATVLVSKIGDLTPVKFGVAPPAASNGDYIYLSNVAGEASLTPIPGAGRVVMVAGVLQGADGVTSKPNVIFAPEYVSRRP
jgi:hypothetical protein